MRDDFARFVDHLGLVRPILIGHSMGGTVAYLLAEAFPTFGGSVPQFSSEPAHCRHTPAISTGIPMARAGACARGRAVRQPVLLRIIRQLNAPDPAWWADLANIQIPLLLIGGGSTTTIAQDKLAEVIARVPSGRLVTLEGAGHSVHRTRRSDFIALVREFLADLSE